LEARGAPTPRGALRVAPPPRESYWKRVGPRPHAAHSAWLRRHAADTACVTPLAFTLAIE